MKVTLRIPTDQYAFIEIETEVEDKQQAVDEYNELQILANNNKEGLNTTEWARVRDNMLKTNEIDPEIIETLSKAQEWWVNQTKLAIRSITKE